jgi:hypothetical protein
MIRTLQAWLRLPAICLAGCLASPTTSLAQTPTYPDRPVRLLIPLAAASAVDVVGGTPEQLSAVMRAEFARMGELIRAANIRE